MDVIHDKKAGANYCAHSTTRVELLPSDSHQYARLICSSCGTRLGFLPRPENVDQRKRNAERLIKLQKLTTLTVKGIPLLGEWERQYIVSLASDIKNGQLRLSPKQQMAFDEIYFEVVRIAHDRAVALRDEKGAK